MKLLGVYPSETAARSRGSSRARKLPGFSDEPDCFRDHGQYTVGKDEWVHGYITTE